MRTAIIHVDGLTQVILAAENDHEKAALNLLAGDKDKTAAIEFKRGSYTDAPAWAFPDECQGGFLRGFDKPHCLMLVVRCNPKD